MIDYLLIGHIASDIVPGGRALGGTVAYAAHVAQAFGLRVGIVTSTAPDEPLLAQLNTIATIHRVESEHTTTYENIYTPSGRVQYVRAVAAPLTSADIPQAWRDAPLVHIAPIADEVAADVTDALTGAVMLTPQGWMRRWQADQRVHFQRWYNADLLRRAHTVVISEEDILEAPEIREEYRTIAHHLVVTRGENGGTYYIHGRQYHYDTPPSQTIDLTGAGDVFSTALFAAWHQCQNYHKAIRIAAKVAARSITQSGIQPSTPPREWLQAIIAEE